MVVLVGPFDHLSSPHATRRYQAQFAEGLAQLRAWFDAGKIKQRETIYEGHTKIPTAFVELFQGKNIGKMLIKC